MGEAQSDYFEVPSASAVGAFLEFCLSQHSTRDSIEVCREQWSRWERFADEYGACPHTCNTTSIVTCLESVKTGRSAQLNKLGLSLSRSSSDGAPCKCSIGHVTATSPRRAAHRSSCCCCDILSLGHAATQPSPPPSASPPPPPAA
jgi:hypothetical protein